MENLQTYTKTFYDFMQMCKIINQKLGYTQREVGKFLYPDGTDFETWYELCGEKNYGKNKKIAQEVYNMAYFDKIPYLDFWHWQIENCCDESFSNDSYSKFCISPELAESEPEWIQNIQNVWYETFKDIADEDGYIDIWVCW